jgi:hypothetical protein
MTFPDGDGENYEYRWVKPTTGDYHGGIHVLRSDNDFDREAWLQKKAERETRERELERQRLEKCLTPAQRDSEIRSILNQLSLSSGDRHYLESRGVPAGIIDNCRSVTKGEYGQKLAHPVHVNLPGAWKDGGGLSIPHSGILVPIADYLGRFTALRLHDPNHKATGNPKYIWLTSKNRGITPNLSNGELPSATHYPGAVTKPEAIGLSEGMEWKAGSGADRLGFPVVGFSGHGAMANSPQQIQALLDHTRAKEIIVIPDDNCLENDSVNKSLIKTVEYWEGKGYTVKIAWWGQTHKGIGDIDEIDSDRQIDFIDKSRFEIEKYQALVIEDQKKLNNFTYEPDILIDSGYFLSLDELQKIKPFPTSGILTLLGAKGSGKSKLIKQVKDFYKSLGYKIVSLTPRVALGRGQSFEWDILWRGDLVEDNQNTPMMVRGVNNLGLCYESIEQLKGRDFSDKHLIILDEVELGLSGAMMSSTHKQRASMLKVLGEMLSEVLASGGVVLPSDADLTDISVDYLKSFGDNVPVFTVKNNAKPKQWDVEFYTGGLTSHDVEKDLFEALESGGNYIYCSDSKAQVQAIEREFLKRFPGEICLNFNGDTTQDDAVKEMIKNINLTILKHKPRLMLHTGSLGTGSSIDGNVKNDDGTITYHQEVYDHFNAVYGNFTHEQPSQCRQYLARYRKPVKRKVWAKESGYKDESCRSYRPSVIKRNLFKDKEASLNIIDLARQIAGDDADDMQILATLHSMMKDGQWDNPHIDLYCNVKARKNYAVSQLSALLLTELTEEGHTIKVYGDSGSNAVSDSIKEIKTEIKWEESAAIANAPDLDHDELKRLQRKRTHTKEERAELSKALIKQELPGIDLDTRFVFDWIVSDRRKKLNAVKLFFYCQHPAIANELDTKEWRYRLKQFGEGCPYLPDVKTFSTKVKVINDIGFFNLVNVDDTTREYRSGDDDVQAFFQRCYMNRYRLNRALGVTVTKKTEPVSLMGRIAKKVGLKFSGKQYREGADHVWVYRLDSEILQNPDRAKILKILDEKHAETLSQQAVPLSQNFSGVCYTLPESSVTDLHPKTQQAKPGTRLAIGSIIFDEILGARRRVVAINGATIHTEPETGQGEVASTHRDWCRLIA